MKTILHVEDEIAVIELVKSMIGTGYNFLAAQNLDEALSIIELSKKKIDLILLDLRIRKEKKIDGEFSGEEMLRRIQELNYKTKVIIVSALSEESKKVKKKYDEIVKGIITKPFLKKDLISLIEKVIGNNNVKKTK